MPEEVERLGVAHHFDEIHFVRDGKSDDDIGRYIDHNHPERSVVVGDRVRSEIEVGNRLGAITIQLKQGIFADELPETDIQKPNHIVETLQEVYGRIVDEVGNPDH
jgi:ribonucleotide monophosphatase NagD (HAD superfamily)